MPHSKPSAPLSQHHFTAMTDKGQRYRGFLIPVALTLAAVVALCVDVPVALTLKNWRANSIFHVFLDFFDLFEPFGHGLGLALVLVVLHQLDPRRRWALPRVAACALASGGLADVVKMLVVRIRPHDFAFDGSVWTTFDFTQWFPMLSAGSGGQSFPSAHTAVAVGLAAALTRLYPQGRLLFSAWAIFVGCQRIVSGAHYPSDVLMGAAVGYLVALLFLKVGCLPKWFDRQEERWQSKQLGDG